MQQSAPKNALGPALKEIRVSRGWTLEGVTARLRDAGMTCTTQQLEQIEAQQRSIRDFELMYFCAALEVTQDALGERLKQAMARRPRAQEK
jgi:transcriptional regulator with XRE-family HTH domain